MSYRQRIIDAIGHKQTDTTPWAFELTAQFADKYKKVYPCKSVDEDLQSHIMFGKYKKMEWIAPDIYRDVFGVQWQLGNDGGEIGIPINKLVDEDSIDTFKFPEFDNTLLDQGLAAMEKDTEHFRMFRLTYALYERAWSLMGMENILMLMASDAEGTQALFERITQYQLGLLDYVLDHDFDGVYFGDDWGQQRGLIMGPAHWRRYIKPQMARMFAKVKAKGKYVLLHSCGDIVEIFEDLIEIGLDVYNTVQPEIYDLTEIKRKYGDRMTFWGAVSTQQFLPYASEAEVREKTEQTIRILGAGGGYILSPTHGVTADISVGNIRAMLETAQNVQWQ